MGEDGQELIVIERCRLDDESYAQPYRFVGKSEDKRSEMPDHVERQSF